MHRKSHIIRDERGSVLVIALLVLGFLTIIGILATRTSNTDIQIANNERINNIIFYAADAGIEVGRAALNDLKVADSGSWDNLLSAAQFTWEGQNVSTLDQVISVGGSRNVGVAPSMASFTLEVEDNFDLDGNLLVDTDNTIILTATGFLQSQPNVQTRIRTTVRYTGGGDEYA